MRWARIDSNPAGDLLDTFHLIGRKLLDPELFQALSSTHMPVIERITAHCVEPSELGAHEERRPRGAWASRGDRAHPHRGGGEGTGPVLAAGIAKGRS